MSYYPEFNLSEEDGELEIILKELPRGETYKENYSEQKIILDMQEELKRLKQGEKALDGKKIRKIIKGVNDDIALLSYSSDNILEQESISIERGKKCIILKLLEKLEKEIDIEKSKDLMEKVIKICKISVYEHNKKYNYKLYSAAKGFIEKYGDFKECLDLGKRNNGCVYIKNFTKKEDAMNAIDGVLEKEFPGLGNSLKAFKNSAELFFDAYSTNKYIKKIEDLIRTHEQYREGKEKGYNFVEEKKFKQGIIRSCYGVEEAVEIATRLALYGCYEPPWLAEYKNYPFKVSRNFRLPSSGKFFDASNNQIVNVQFSEENSLDEDNGAIVENAEDYLKEIDLK